MFHPFFERNTSYFHIPLAIFRSCKELPNEAPVRSHPVAPSKRPPNRGSSAEPRSVTWSGVPGRPRATTCHRDRPAG